MRVRDVRDANAKTVELRLERLPVHGVKVRLADLEVVVAVGGVLQGDGAPHLVGSLPSPAHSAW